MESGLLLKCVNKEKFVWIKENFGEGKSGFVSVKIPQNMSMEYGLFGNKTISMPLCKVKGGKNYL